MGRGREGEETNFKSVSESKNSFIDFSLFFILSVKMILSDILLEENAIASLILQMELAL